MSESTFNLIEGAFEFIGVCTSAIIVVAVVGFLGGLMMDGFEALRFKYEYARYMRQKRKTETPKG